MTVLLACVPMLEASCRKAQIRFGSTSCHLVMKLFDHFTHDAEVLTQGTPAPCVLGSEVCESRRPPDDEVSLSLKQIGGLAPCS